MARPPQAPRRCPRGLLTLLLVLSLSGLLAGCGRAYPPARNVVLISVDTLRPDRLGCYGYARDTSPNLDALCAESAVFEQAISHAPSTLPSHASMLTSLLPHRHGASFARRRALPEEVETVTEVLRARGFRTASFNDGGQIAPAWRLGQGFETYRSQRGHRFADRVREARNWLDSLEPRERFFLFLHTYEVHHPYAPSEEDLARFEDVRYDGWLGRRVDVGELRRINSGRAEAGPEDRRFIEIAYDAGIRSMDRALGALLGDLRERGLLEDTLVVFTSDHGEELGEHGKLGWHSHTLYDELLRVPLVVRLPEARRAGRRVQRQVRLIDLAPTIADAAGVPAPKEWQGVSLLRVLEGDDLPPLPAVAELDGHDTLQGLALRAGRWKWYAGRLYDLRTEPSERHDFTVDHPAVAAALRRRLLEHIGGAPRLDATEGVELDPETIRELEALGYL